MHKIVFVWKEDILLTKSVKDSSKPSKLEQVLIEDIQPNDYFLICSDGITGNWLDADLEELFSNFKSSSEIIHELRKQCEIISEDNFTAIIFKIESISIL